VPRVVLFDLDGMLSDSSHGILTALRHAFTVHGLPPLDATAEQAVLGPPFADTLPPYLGAVPLAAVVETYRQHYLAGPIYDTALFDGLLPVLHWLRAAGVTLAVATSKREQHAVLIVEHLGLTDLFATIGGDEPDLSLSSKAKVIGKVLRRLGDPSPADVVMVGDRKEDVLGARTHGIRCVGAGWGYGRPGELVRARADPVCARPADLLAALEPAA
jgi:phosphoglycolate phosphatase